nr:hypothetical protein [Amycolatopsis sp.]
MVKEVCGDSGGEVCRAAFRRDDRRGKLWTGAAEPGRTFAFGGNERSHIDEVSHAGETGDHRTAIGMPEYHGKPAHRVDDLLHRFGVRFERAAMKFGNRHVESLGPERTRDEVEMLRVVIETVNKHDAGREGSGHICDRASRLGGERWFSVVPGARVA